MPILVQARTEVLLSTQKFHHKGLGPCTDLELQFKVCPNPLGALLFWESQDTSYRVYSLN